MPFRRYKRAIASILALAAASGLFYTLSVKRVRPGVVKLRFPTDAWIRQLRSAWGTDKKVVIRRVTESGYVIEDTLVLTQPVVYLPKEYIVSDFRDDDVLVVDHPAFEDSANTLGAVFAFDSKSGASKVVYAKALRVDLRTGSTTVIDSLPISRLWRGVRADSVEREWHKDRFMKAVRGEKEPPHPKNRRRKKARKERAKLARR